MYNECVNTILKYAVKWDKLKGLEIERPVSIHDKTPLPPPPLPGEIEVLLAGFPWQVKR
jgi:DNA (cytosine-5)-methyltransferase 1